MNVQFELFKTCIYCGVEHPYHYKCPVKETRIGQLQIDAYGKFKWDYCNSEWTFKEFVNYIEGLFENDIKWENINQLWAIFPKPDREWHKNRKQRKCNLSDLGICRLENSEAKMPEGWVEYYVK